MNIAEKLVKLRKEKGLTQEKLAQELNISIASIKNYENVKTPREPKNDILLKFAKFYDVSTKYLLNDEITNKTNDNIIIGTELKLSDNAIKTIKRFSKYNLSDTFNMFLEYQSISRIMYALRNIKNLYIIQKNYIGLFLTMEDFRDFFIQSIISNNITNIQNSINILKIYQTNINKCISFINNNSYLDKEIFIDIYKMQETLDRILLNFNNYVENKVYYDNAIQMDSYNFIQLSYKIYENILIHIKYNKYEVNDLLGEFLHEISPTIYDSSELYYSELDKYYKYSSLGNPKHLNIYIENNNWLSMKNKIAELIKKNGKEAE